MSRGVVVAAANYSAAYDWCLNTFEPATVNGCTWYVDYQPLLDPEFVFSNDAEAELFMLRWL